MTNEIWAGLEVFTGIILPVILGLTSSVARVAHYGWHGFRRFIADSIVCVFVSIVVFWGLDMFPDIIPTVRAAITSLSALMCNELLVWVRKRMRREILGCPNPEEKGKEG